VKVAIHQPTFLPWLGVINKMYRADLLVVLDHVQAPNEASWLNRNRILVDGAPRWLTVPRSTAHRGYQPVDALEIDYASGFPDRQLNALRQAYSHHPAFAEVFSAFEVVFTSRWTTFAAMNGAFMDTIRNYAGLDTPMVSSRVLARDEPELVELRRSELLVKLCRLVGADCYLSGDGSDSYLDPGLFEAGGLDLEFQRYAPPPYPQRGVPTFISHLSVADALFNVGFDGLHRLIATEPA
jgi:hypothetical protein